MTRGRLTPALIVIDALLALALAAAWLAPVGPSAHWRNWQAPAPQAPNLDNVRAAQLAPNPALRRDYPSIVERPLFAANRKPRAAAASDAPGAAPPSDSLDQVKLYGLVDGPASQGVLLEQDGQPHFVRRGEKFGDWTLQAVEERDAIFVKGDERRTVPLPDSLSLSHAAAGAPAATADTAATADPAAPRHAPASEHGTHALIQPIPAPGQAPRPGQPPAAPRFGGGAAGSQAQPQPAAAAGVHQPAAQRASGGRL